MLLGCGVWACVPPDQTADAASAAEINLDLHNKAVQQVYNLRDRHRTDSLLLLLKSPEATLRYLAALSFASVRDSQAVGPLAAALQDPVKDVRWAAAYSLGQIGHPKCEKPLIEAFRSDDSTSEHQLFNALVLEAVGKCGSPATLRHIATVSTYKSSDTLLMLGQCRAIFHYMLRKITDPTATARMVSVAANERMPAPARMVAAQYLARAPGLQYDSLQAQQLALGLIRSVGRPDIRMGIATALGKSPTRPAFAILSKTLATETDWRVQANMLNALARFEYDTVRSLVTPFLFHANPQLSRTAAEFFIANGQPQDADYYWRIGQTNTQLPMPVKIALFHASNRLLSNTAEPESKDFVNYRLREFFQQSKSPYERASCLMALAEYGWQYRWIHDKGFNDPHPAVKTAAAQAIMKILKKPNFYAAFGEGAKGVRRELYYYLREITASGDVGMITAAAGGYRIEALNFKTLRDSLRLENLQASLQKLKMPRDLEAYVELDSTIAYFEERAPAAPYQPRWNHPIDWKRLQVVNSNTEVTIETENGKIVLQLLPQWAPGTVSSFLDLVGSNYYNGKNFHRVAINHVTQGGCPRGDGTGAEDFTLRTEIGLAWYDAEGYVGMASAGPDTEGTQFFITHSPRPHLDGRYTIFGKVKSGMDVVCLLQPGDVMNRVTVDYKN
ncbi:MAG TPA: peptidylprolyl isomerase [Saprospiraceae bacterium]|nr:peptidylprolyl isomerase [Saprospiraceae bacterium]